MEDYGVLELIGEGSTRKVYSIGNGLCLKVAKNADGFVQNKVEMSNLLYSLKCFPKLDSYESDFKAIIVQQVKACNFIENAEQIIANAFKVQGDNFLERLSQMLVFIADNRLHAEDIHYIVEDKRLDSLWKVLACKIANPKNEAQKALAQLAEHVSWHYDDFSPYDLDDIRNWGIVQHGRSIVPVVIDAGFKMS